MSEAEARAEEARTAVLNSFRAATFHWWHNGRLRRWLCPICRKLDRLERDL